VPSGSRFLDLWGIRELRGIRLRPRSVVLGALTTFREIRDHAELRHKFPSLTAAAAEVGAWQIQNRATLAGNVANASPAGDSLPVLLAHDAVIHARSARGARAIPFEALYTGYRALALAPDELIVSIELPFAPARAHAFFRKVGTRRAQSISKVVMAGVLRRDAKGLVDHVRLAFGSVAPTTLRARQVERALLGRPLGKESAAAAREALASDIAPIDDIRSSRDYRLAVAANVLDQFLRSAIAG
jgi:xanthine dehydrogenase small subunit